MTGHESDGTARTEELVKRLLAHRAHPKTIADLTGLSRPRVASLRRRFTDPAVPRHRGPPPNSLGNFLHNAAARTEWAAAATVYYKTLGVSPTPGDKSEADRQISLETVERLCEAYERCPSYVPDRRLSFDQFWLLIVRIAHGNEIQLSSCKSCGNGILVFPSDSGEPLCADCQRAPRTVEGCTGEVSPSVLDRASGGPGRGAVTPSFQSIPERLKGEGQGTLPADESVGGATEPHAKRAAVARALSEAFEKALRARLESPEGKAEFGRILNIAKFKAFEEFIAVLEAAAARSRGNEKRYLDRLLERLRSPRQ
jgi:hypothetical protein